MGKEKRKRKPEEIVLQEFRITLSGEEIVLPVRSMRTMVDFRRKLADIIADVVEKHGEKFNAALSGGEVDEENLAPLLASLVPFLVSDGWDALEEMLWLYAPDLKEEHFESAADAEILCAGVEVLKIAIPLIVRVGKALLDVVQNEIGEDEA